MQCRSDRTSSACPMGAKRPWKEEEKEEGKDKTLERTGGTGRTYGRQIRTLLDGVTVIILVQVMCFVQRYFSFVLGPIPSGPVSRQEAMEEMSRKFPRYDRGQVHQSKPRSRLQVLWGRCSYTGFFVDV